MYNPIPYALLPAACHHSTPGLHYFLPVLPKQPYHQFSWFLSNLFPTVYPTSFSYNSFPPQLKTSYVTLNAIRRNSKSFLLPTNPDRTHLLFLTSLTLQPAQPAFNFRVSVWFSFWNCINKNNHWYCSLLHFSCCAVNPSFFIYTFQGNVFMTFLIQSSHIS